MQNPTQIIRKKRRVCKQKTRYRNLCLNELVAYSSPITSYHLDSDRTPNSGADRIPNTIPLSTVVPSHRSPPNRQLFPKPPLSNPPQGPVDLRLVLGRVILHRQRLDPQSAPVGGQLAGPFKRGDAGPGGPLFADLMGLNAVHIPRGQRLIEHEIAVFDGGGTPAPPLLPCGPAPR